MIIKNDDWIYTVQMNPEEYDAFRTVLSACLDEDDPHPLLERMLTQMNIHAMRSREIMMNDFNLAKAQALAYVWGRNDQKNETAGRLAGPDADSVEFSNRWAEVVARGGSRPDLSGAFDNFRAGRELDAPRQ